MIRGQTRGQDSSDSGPPLAARIRILETTDLHMQLMGYDYFADQPTPDLGLIPLAGLIEAHREDLHVTTFLFDNGDFLQGNPLADYVTSDAQAGTPHPMIAAFNALSYDAVALGNHEFNYGLDVLDSVLSTADFPALCANVKRTDGSDLVPPYVIIDKQIMCSDGHLRQLRVGVIGLVPPQIVRWDKPALAGQLTACDIVETARHAALHGLVCSPAPLSSVSMAPLVCNLVAIAQLVHDLGRSRLCGDACVHCLPFGWHELPACHLLQC